MDSHFRSLVPAFPFNRKHKHIRQDCKVPDISSEYLEDISLEIALLGFFENNNLESKPVVEKSIEINRKINRAMLRVLLHWTTSLRRLFQLLPSPWQDDQLPLYGSRIMLAISDPENLELFCLRGCFGRCFRLPPRC